MLLHKDKNPLLEPNCAELPEMPQPSSSRLSSRVSRLLVTLCVVGFILFNPASCVFSGTSDDHVALAENESSISDSVEEILSLTPLIGMRVTSGHGYIGYRACVEN